jgi:hypothetical protein
MYTVRESQYSGLKVGKQCVTFTQSLRRKFVPTGEVLGRFVNNGHTYVEGILDMCAQGLDDRDFRPFRGAVMVASSRGEEDV